MKQLILASGEFALVDDDIYEIVKDRRWCLSNGYPSCRQTTNIGESRILYLHQFVLGHAPRGMHIDHINRNKLDNRRENLRHVTHQVNMLNRKKKAKGVSYDRTHRKYKAYYDKITIGKPKKRINIGTFNTESEAVEARQKFLEEQKRCAT
jgi:hypothetical protein